jgi:hypothetical protein
MKTDDNDVVESSTSTQHHRHHRHSNRPNPQHELGIVRSVVELQQSGKTEVYTELFPGGGRVATIAGGSSIAVITSIEMETARSARLFVLDLQVVCLLDGGVESIGDAHCVQTRASTAQVECECAFDPEQGGVHSVTAYAVMRGDPSAELLGDPVYVRTSPGRLANVHEVVQTPKLDTIRALPGATRLPVGVYFSTIFGNGAAVWNNMTEVLGHNPLTVESALTSGTKFQV